MSTIVRIADSKGRVSLPGFANAAVILEAVNANEYRVRKAEIIPADELEFSEERMPKQLSPRDARAFVKSVEKPPRPNAAARRAARRLRKRVHG
jgi:uncharacterized protein (DUF1778 family)